MKILYLLSALTVARNTGLEGEDAKKQDAQAESIATFGGSKNDYHCYFRRRAAAARKARKWRAGPPRSPWPQRPVAYTRHVIVRDADASPLADSEFGKAVQECARIS
jgi:hypothetical protein